MEQAEQDVPDTKKEVAEPPIASASVDVKKIETKEAVPKGQETPSTETSAAALHVRHVMTFTYLPNNKR